jgi:hypothetical protein
MTPILIILFSVLGALLLIGTILLYCICFKNKGNVNISSDDGSGDKHKKSEE